MGASYSYVRKFAIARTRSPAREARALPRVLEFGFIRVDAWLTAAKILQILIDESGNFLMLCVPRQADRLHAWSWRSSGLRVEPILVRLLTKAGFCLVPERETIFDSLVSGFKQHRRRGNPECAKSANIELCVICRSSLK